MKQYVGRAEFFALPALRIPWPIRPRAAAPLRLQYFKRLLDVVRAQNQ
jgi:hypothetical protein